MRKRTLEDLCNAYLAETHLEHERYTHYLQTTFLRTVVREFGHVLLEDVTPDLLRTWKVHLSQRYKTSTVWRYLMYLSAVLAFAVESEWLDANPHAAHPQAPCWPGTRTVPDR